MITDGVLNWSSADQSSLLHIVIGHYKYTEHTEETFITQPLPNQLLMQKH